MLIQFWMVVFPEGTRFNPDLPDVIEKYRNYAKAEGEGIGFLLNSNHFY